jgi:hypothetical protein
MHQKKFDQPPLCRLHSALPSTGKLFSVTPTIITMSAAATTPATPTTSAPASTLESDTSVDWPLSPDEYLRYGRQMIMPEWGLDGELQQ